MDAGQSLAQAKQKSKVHAKSKAHQKHKKGSHIKHIASKEGKSKK